LLQIGSFLIFLEVFSHIFQERIAEDRFVMVASIGLASTRIGWIVRIFDGGIQMQHFDFVGFASNEPRGLLARGAVLF
jgi:hypothetical protein